MARPDEPSIDGAVDQHGVHEIRGPLIVGGVELLRPATGFFRDLEVRRRLSSKQRFEAYLQFREEAFKIAATELVAAFNSPVDLFLLTAEDAQQFQSDYLYHHISFREPSHHFTIVDDQSNVSGADNVSATSASEDDQSSDIHDYQHEKELTLQLLHYTQRYFVYRKGLVKLNINQFGNDTEKALEWLKSSTGWSELHENELRRGLKSHMDFLKEHEMSKMNPPSITEHENVALERINVELASELEKRLETSDWELMGHYYNRMKLRNLARVCSTQAQASGVILVKQALPLREICKEQVVSTSPEVLKFPSMKQAVKQSLDGCLGSLRRVHEKFGRGANRVAWLAFIPFATAATFGVSNRR